MNKEKLNLVLDLYKEGHIDKEQAYQLLEEPDFNIEPIKISEPVQPICPYPYPYPFNYPIIIYSSNKTTLDPSEPVK